MNEEAFSHILAYIDEHFSIDPVPTAFSATEENLRKLISFNEHTIQAQIDEQSGEFIGWTVSLPTTTELMDRFLDAQIQEEELFIQTMNEDIGVQKQAVYMCGVFVSPAYRGKGNGRALVESTMATYKEEFPETVFFCWPWKCAGRKAAAHIAQQVDTSVYMRTVE